MKIKGVQDYSHPFAVKVYVDGVLLSHKASCKVVNHSPTGFQWGYHGSGPAQLALAILMLRTDDESAERLHQDFKRDFIVVLPKDENFETDMDIDWWIKNRQYPVKHRTVGLGKDSSSEQSDGECYYPEKCQRATWKQCDCQCGGVNHGIQTRMFDLK